MATSSSCYSAAEVLQFLDGSVDEGNDDEPFMEGSEDEFDDLTEEESYNDINDFEDSLQSQLDIPANSPIPLDLGVYLAQLCCHLKHQQQILATTTYSHQ